jgi:peptide deformylase
MAIRNIVKIGDEILTKRSRKVEKIDDRIITLLDDMKDTLDEAKGVGLAAPQVGVLKRVVVLNIEDNYWELINPEIISASEEMVNDIEGCLSVPGKWGYVERPKTVTVRAKDRNGETFELNGSDLLARALCHEIDHLNGELYVDKVSEFVDPDELEEDE